MVQYNEQLSHSSSCSSSLPPPHFLLVTFPAQGHINPSLQFAKRLILTTGAHVTFITTLSAHKRTLDSLTHPNLTYAPFSDGFDGGFDPSEHDSKTFMSEIERRGSESLTQTIIASSSSSSNARLHVIYTLLLPWAADVAHNLTVSSTLLWIQPAIVFDIYHYYFNGYKDLIANNNNDPSYPIKLPGLPLLTCHDIPSFFLPSGESTFAALSIFEKQFEALHKFKDNSKRKPRVLVNTFDALEIDAISAVDDTFDLIGIGPLLPSAFLDNKDPSDVSFGGDLFHGSHKQDYIEWLDNHEQSSVVYVSFGSLSVLDPKQMDELARGLIESGVPFLWVIRPQKKSKTQGEEDEEWEGSRILSYIEKEEEKGNNIINVGKIVKWCSQVEVLSHKSVGCFVTHCGWNSSLEGLVCGGVPMVGFPQWSDQGTNAKLIEDVWRVGVRVREKKYLEGENEKKIVESEEIRRCLGIVMGGNERSGEEMRRNARKWKELGKEAVVEGGSSERNLREFVGGFGGDLGL